MANYTRQMTQQFSDEAPDTSVRFQTYMQSDGNEPPVFTLTTRMIVKRAGVDTKIYDMSEIGNDAERATVNTYLKKVLTKHLRDNGATLDVA